MLQSMGQEKVFLSNSSLPSRLTQYLLRTPFVFPTPSDVFSKYYDGGNPQGQFDTKSSVPQLAGGEILVIVLVFPRDP